MQIEQQKPVVELENIFISGIDSTITESEVVELFRFTTNGEVIVKFHHYYINGKEKNITEVQLTKEKAVMAHSKLNGQKIKDCVMQLIPQNCMKQVVISGLPLVFSEKDMFLLINTKSQGLKNIIIADDPQENNKTQGVLIATFKTFELAQNAIKCLNNAELMKKKVECYWKEPEDDLMLDLSLQTRSLLIKNLSFQTNQEGLQQAFKEFGVINKIVLYANKAFVEFDSTDSAKRAFTHLNKKRVDGKTWEICPAKRENRELIRDGVEKNLKYSVEFFGNQLDKENLVRMGIDGQMPAINPIVQQKANQIIQQVKQLQKNQIDMLKIQIENQKQLNSQNFSNFNSNNNNNNNNQKNKQNLNTSFNNNNNNVAIVNENLNQNLGNNSSFNNNNNNAVNTSFNNGIVNQQQPQVQQQQLQQQQNNNNNQQQQVGINPNNNNNTTINGNTAIGFGQNITNNATNVVQQQQQPQQINQNSNGFNNNTNINGMVQNNNNAIQQQNLNVTAFGTNNINNNSNGFNNNSNNAFQA